MTNAASLLNTPREDTDWDRWSFDLNANISDLIEAIRAQKHVSIVTQQIYPISLPDIGQWLERMSQTLGEITGTLSIQAADVENVDLTDERERQAWIWQVFSEVNAAREALKI